MRKNNIENLRRSIIIAGKRRPIREFPKAFRLVVWELMKAITRLNRIEKRLKGKKCG